MAAVFQRGDLAGAVGHVKFADGHTIQVLIRHLGDLAVGSIIVYVTILCIAVIAHALQPLEFVIGIFHLAAVAEGRFLQGIIVIVFVGGKGQNRIIFTGQKLIAHLYGGRPVAVVKAEMIDHIAGIARGIMGHICAYSCLKESLPGLENRGDWYNPFI